VLKTNKLKIIMAKKAKESSWGPKKWPVQSQTPPPKTTTKQSTNSQALQNKYVPGSW
jgi:hypothetical protein